MKRPPIEVADIIRAVGKSFIDKNQSWLNGLHLKVLSGVEKSIEDWPGFVLPIFLYR